MDDVTSVKDAGVRVQIAGTHLWRRQLVFNFLFLAPCVVLICLVFLGPLVYLLKNSFYPANSQALSFLYYRKFLSDQYYLGVLWRTLRVSFIVTVLTLVLGYTLAYTITFITAGGLRSMVVACTLVPVAVNLVILTYGWVTLLSPRGVLNSFLMAVGVLHSPRRFLFSEAAIVVGLAHSNFPFMTLCLTSALMKIDPLLLRASENLGASPGKTFTHVILPLSLPGIVAGSLLVFTLSVSAFVTPALLGGSRNRVMTYLIYEQELFLANEPFAAAETVILMGVAALAIAGYLRVTARYTRGLAA